MGAIRRRRAADDIQIVPLARMVLTAVAALAFSATALAAVGDPQYRPADADQRWADAIVLTAGDLGGSWQGSGAGGRIASAGFDAGLCSLPDESDLVVTGGAYSQSFMRGDGASVSSAALVWQTAEHAQADWDRTFQPAIMGCLASELQSSSTRRVKVVVTARRRLAWPGLAPRAVAYRLSFVLRARAASIRATADFVAVGSGRATAMLWTTSFASPRLGDSAKQQYALSMLRRMAADPSA